MRRLTFGAVVVATALLGLAPAAHAQSGASSLPPIKHVFILVLENESFDATFGPNPGSPYLGNDLRAQGSLLTQYYATGHVSLDNYITMVSGQPPVPLTQADCAGVPFVLCAYPALIPTIGGQLDAAGQTWRGYMEDMATPCQHPPDAQPDPNQQATAGSQYATRHDPFVYFKSITDDAAACAQHVVNLDQLPSDLANAATTPSYVFITPDLCHDGHDATCADGGPGGYAGVDVFLRQWVPLIEQSPAWPDSLLLITFDESTPADTGSCCFSTPLAGISGNGGGRVGALAISPFVAPGTTSAVPYNHYSMLASVEDLFGLGRLGGAAQPQSVPFGPDVYNAPSLTSAGTGTTNAGDAAGDTAAAPATLPATGGPDGPLLTTTALLLLTALVARRFTRAR